VDAPQIIELFRDLSGNRDGQYTIDVSADAIAVTMLTDAGLGVLSEESGLTDSDREFLVVVDPIDGSTNASAGLPTRSEVPGRSRTTSRFAPRGLPR